MPVIPIIDAGLTAVLQWVVVPALAYLVAVKRRPEPPRTAHTCNPPRSPNDGRIGAVGRLLQKAANVKMVIIGLAKMIGQLSVFFCSLTEIPRSWGGWDEINLEPSSAGSSLLSQWHE